MYRINVTSFHFFFKPTNCYKILLGDEVVVLFLVAIKKYGGYENPSFVKHNHERDLLQMCVLVGRFLCISQGKLSSHIFCNMQHLGQRQPEQIGPGKVLSHLIVNSM